MSTILEISNLTKKFGSFVAVNNLSLKVEPGEIFALIGPNGSGKTTIIKIIVGLLKATEGKVKINNADVEEDPITSKSYLGYIPDEPSVWNYLTGEEFLHIVGTLHNIEEKERTKRIKSLLKIYDLEGIQKGYFQNYSRGNKQKFTFLGALLHKPEILVIDEPAVGLDPKSISTTENELQKYTKAGGTIFMATHILSIASSTASRIGVLKEGKLITVGNLNELRKQAQLASKASLEDIYLKLTENK
ncbi:ABC transporter ATP-binding protein [Candidatus Dojkabacteria bacterium]|nr:ABC transporter ATP-binding protein [Candidatus Dojkabacteria bacterium]